MAVHRHRFAVWTAARAVSRNFTSTAVVEMAIDKTDLRKFAEGSKHITAKTWREFHIRACNQLIKSLKQSNAKNPSYGRAAKIVAVYLKASVIIVNNIKDDKMEFIHPPIDYILLSALAKHTKIHGLRTKKWTQLNKTAYWELVELIGKHDLPLNWKLEEWWNPAREKK